MSEIDLRTLNGSKDGRMNYFLPAQYRISTSTLTGPPSCRHCHINFSMGSLKLANILRCASRCFSDARVLVPHVECLGPDRTICGGCQSMSSWMEMTVDKGVRGEKALSLPR